MKGNILSLAVRGILGGIWALMSVILTYMFSAWVSVSSFLYYPLVFAGAALIAVSFSGKGVSAPRALSVGAVSGLVLQLVSPVFALFGAILAGASLGGGLSQGAGVLRLLLNTLKGAVVLPVVVFTGYVVSGAISLFFSEMPLVHWFFWGFWVVVGISFIVKADNKDREYESQDWYCGTVSELDEFREEAKNITTEISELNSKIYH